MMQALQLHLMYAVLGLIGLVFAPYPMPGQVGAYNPLSRTYVCANYNACLHEQGHKIDHELNWPSQSEVFRQAVVDYIVAEFTGTPSVHAIMVMNTLLTRDGEYAELYADMWAWAGGEVSTVPEEFRAFYEESHALHHANLR